MAWNCSLWLFWSDWLCQGYSNPGDPLPAEFSSNPNQTVQRLANSKCDFTSSTPEGSVYQHVKPCAFASFETGTQSTLHTKTYKALYRYNNRSPFLIEDDRIASFIWGPHTCISQPCVCNHSFALFVCYTWPAEVCQQQITKDSIQHIKPSRSPPLLFFLTTAHLLAVCSPGPALCNLLH